ncbi:hypothetical protein [Methylobacterium mesophilicum]
MIEGDDPTLKAVKVLVAADYMVERFDEDPTLWRLNGEVMTGAELLNEAHRLGLMDE